MDQNIKNTKNAMSVKEMVIMVIALVLGLAGLVLIMISVFHMETSNWILIAGLACICVGNVLNFIRMAKSRKAAKAAAEPEKKTE